MSNDKTDRSIVIAGMVLLPMAFALSLLIGSRETGSGALIGALFGRAGNPAAELILFRIRLPRSLAAAICGAGLSISGLLLQSVLNNSLASPGVLGVNAGAGFMALIAGILFPFHLPARQCAAFSGALLAAVLVYAISMRAGVSKTTLILAGVAVSSLFTAGSNAIVTIRPDAVADKVAFSLGGLHGSAYLLGGSIDLFTLGDEAAQGLGLNTARVRMIAILISSALAAASVSICGLLGFVGLIIPNLVRFAGIRTTRSRILCCAVWGSTFLLFCDMLARTLFYPYELPAGLLLSMIGTPFFIWMLMRKKRRLGAA